MGQSLPMPTDSPPGPRTGPERTSVIRVSASPAADDRGNRVPSTGPAEASVTDIAEPGVDAFSAAIVRGKVRAPVMRATTLERPRLLEWLEQHAEHRGRGCTAETGYGKSTRTGATA